MIQQGFTGTRRGMTPLQRRAAEDYLRVNWPDTLIHGGAVGADQEIDELVTPIFWDKTSGATRMLRDMMGALKPLIVLPGSHERAVYWREQAAHAAIREVWDPMAPLRRNRSIVGMCTRLLACPREGHEVLRSGTWATIRYAWSARKPVTIIFPDGTTTRDPQID